MDSDIWRGWRERAKLYKDDHDLNDATLAAEITAMREDRGLGEKKVERGTVNSWLNKREPNLADFMDLCAAMGADPGHILFESPVLRELVPQNSRAREVTSASPTATPGHGSFMKRLKNASKSREFKKKRQRLRRGVLVKA